LGERTTTFWNKLHTKKHARTERFPKGGVVYHLFSRRLYHQIDRENIRNRRQHEIEYIQRRIGILDFILSNLQYRYLETEPEKMSFFCDQLKTSRHFLPSKIYYGQRTSQPTLRYFVDKFPMFLDGDAASTVVTFTYLQGQKPVLRNLCVISKSTFLSSGSSRSSAFSICRESICISEKPKNYSMLWSKSQGLPLAADNLRKKALRTACKRAGLQRIDWHTLRHTHGTLLHSQGTPLKVAQAQLGHSHMATTLDIYTHASGSAQRDAVNLLEEQLFPIVPKLENCGNIAETESQLVQ
jgi:hypothetical protein